MKILEDIGLTKTESEIYERLLQLGECSVSALQRSLSIHPQIAYRTIDSLKEKGLATVIRKKNKQYVSAEHPKKLEDIEKERLLKLRSAIPELVHLMKPRKESIVRTSIGHEAIKSFRRQAIQDLKRNDSILIIGGSADRFYDVMGEDYKEIEEKRIKKKIHKKLIAFASEREKFQKDPHQLFSEFRYLSSHHPTTTSTNVFGDHVGIIIWTADPVLLHIHDGDVADSYRHYFDELWATARK